MRTIVFSCILALFPSIVSAQIIKPVYELGDSLAYECGMVGSFTNHNYRLDKKECGQVKGKYILTLKFTHRSNDTLFARAFINNVNMQQEVGASLDRLNPDTTVGPWIYNNTELRASFDTKKGTFITIEPVVMDIPVMTFVQRLQPNFLLLQECKEGVSAGDRWQSIVHSANTFLYATSYDTAFYTARWLGIIDTLGARRSVYQYVVDSLRSSGSPYMRIIQSIGKARGTVMFDPNDKKKRIIYVHQLMESGVEYTNSMLTRSMGEEEGPNPSGTAISVRYKIDRTAKLLYRN